MKKHLLLFIALLLISVAGNAQAPEKLSYQAVIRNEGNVIVTSQPVGMRISILQGSASGSVVYAETQQSSTNATGLVTLEIGSGAVVSGFFAAIDWTSGPYFIKTETDPEGGNNYSLTGTSQLLSVPYALYAKTSGSSVPGPQGPAGSAGKNALIRTTPETAGANCANGGVKIETGLDADGNGQLTDSEVNGSQTKYLCNGATGSQGPAGPAGSGGFVHYVGEQFGGGVVFHVYRDAAGVERGLVVSTSDQSEGMVWSNIPEQINDATSLWDGLYNSNIIVNQPGHTNSAAKICFDYEGGGFTDWYLPANIELTQLWNGLGEVNRTLSMIPGSSQVFPSSASGLSYWSSSTNGGNLIAWYIESAGNLSYGDMSILHRVRAIRAYSVPSGSGNSVADVDGNTYETVTIGSQVWMKENLKVSKYRNGDIIPTGLSNTEWFTTTSGACAIYNNLSANNATYGKVYNWFAVSDSRGLCPIGWHVSTDSDWTTLENTLGGSAVAGGMLKSTSSLWQTPNAGATNSTGFSALPGGVRQNNGNYVGINFDSYWWTADEANGSLGWDRTMRSDTSSINRYTDGKEGGFYVRCVKD